MYRSAGDLVGCDTVLQQRCCRLSLLLFL